MLEIKEIYLKTHNLVESSSCNYDPQTLLVARLSVLFCVVLAALNGQVTLQNFIEKRISDLEIGLLIGKIISG